VTLPGLSETTEEQALLKQWNTQDPPDAWEVGRNDYIETIQHNRNPFVDHPEYVDMIDFNTMTLAGSGGTPVLAAVPSNHVTNFAAGTTTSSSIQVTWTDAAAGAQAPAGYLVMANTSGVFTTPAAGTPVTDDANLADGTAAVHVAYAAADTYTFSGLARSPRYYFQIVPYNGTGTSVNYKTDGTIPAIDVTTSDVVIPPGGLVPGAFTGIYEFTGVSTADNQFNAVTTQPSFGTFSTVTRTGVVWTGGSNYFNSNSWPTAGARDDAKYVAFTLTLASGYVFQNLPLTLAFDISHSSTGPASGEVRYCYGPSGTFASVATFTPPLTSATQTMTVPAPGNFSSTSLELRIYGWGATGSGGTFRLDNVKLSTPAESNLPVELVAFTARPAGGSVELQWSTATETNNFGFAIERSPLAAAGDAGRSWSTIGFVEGSGTSNAAHHYSFIDRPAAGSYVYRLKQTDRDGKYEYSRETMSCAAVPARFGLAQNYPNPFNPATTISFACGVTEHATLDVFNIMGQHVTTLFNGLAEGQRPYTVTFDATGYASGMYIYRLSTHTRTEIKRMSFMK
jgi:hypothetical protein